MIRTMIFAGIAVLMTSVANAADYSPEQIDAIADLIAPSGGASREWAEKDFLGAISAYDLDGNGLTMEEAEKGTLVTMAELRGIALISVSPFDLDEDLEVTPAEIEAVLSSPHGENRKHGLSSAMSFDVDRDGTISKEEIMAPSDFVPIVVRAAIVGSLFDDDGHLTSAEAMTIIDDVFRRYDTDGDATISPEENEIMTLSSPPCAPGASRLLPANDPYCTGIAR